MTQQTIVSKPRGGGLAAAGAAPAAGVGLAGALLAMAVSAVHVADQGGLTRLADPDWIGWGYRAIEVGGLLTALTLLLAVLAGRVLAGQALAGQALAGQHPAGQVLAGRALAARALARLGWAATLLLGAAPLLGYLASRTIGLPGDADDVGNWGDWVGMVSLFLEAGLIVLSVSVLLALRARPTARPAAAPGPAA
jgi:hypothetical protein